jgi:hypothetical protein
MLETALKLEAAALAAVALDPAEMTELPFR